MKTLALSKTSHRVSKLILAWAIFPLFILAPLSRALSQTGPEIKIAQQEIDFGRVNQGDKVMREFVVTNTGDKELILNRIAPSCGCTAAAVTSPTIKPGSSEKIRVTFDTAGMFGDKIKSVHLFTNIDKNPEVVLRLKGFVARGFSVDPERVVFGDLSPAAPGVVEGRSQEISVTIDPQLKHEIARIFSSSKSVSVKPLDGELPAARRFSVAVAGDAQKGELRERIVFEFKDPAHAAVNVPVLANIVGELRIQPAVISFGLLSGEEVLERRAKFESSAKDPVKILGVVSSSPALSAQVEGLTPAKGGGERGQLVMRLDPKQVAADLKATVQIKTSHPDYPELTVSVYGVKAPSR
jgi:hypothetical protein